MVQVRHGKNTAAAGTDIPRSTRVLLLCFKGIVFVSLAWLATNALYILSAGPNIAPGHSIVSPHNMATSRGAGRYLRDPKDEYTLAFKESGGFFTDISDESWRRRKRRFQQAQPNYQLDAARREKQQNYNNVFWSENFEPEFTCPEEERIGMPKLGDGPKWICDPYRIAEQARRENRGCLVYSIGSNGNTMFERGVREEVWDECEVHTFDLMGYNKNTKLNFTVEVAKVGAIFHEWGITGGESGQPAKRSAKQFKTFGQTIKELGHAGRVIDIMKIDMETWEWPQYKSWHKDWKESGVFVRQVLIELHNSPYPESTDFFLEMQRHNYVIFHKEPNYLNDAKCVEMAFLKLDASFFEKGAAAD